MAKSKWVMMAAVALVLGLTAGPVGAVDKPSYMWPQLPELDIQPPSALPEVPEGVPEGPVAVSERDMAAAIVRGRDLARGEHDLRLQSTRVLEPWRVIVDADGEYATLLTPASSACLLRYYAEQRSWREDVLQRRLQEARERFGQGVCVYVELRSYAHERRGFGSAGTVCPGTPGETYEALFLLSAGGQRFEAVTSAPPGSTVVRTHVGAAAELTALNRQNTHGLWYQRVDLPGMTSYTRTHGFTSGKSYGANYYVWLPLVDEAGNSCYGPNPGSLTLIILTPNRRREFAFTRMH